MTQSAVAERVVSLTLYKASRDGGSRATLEGVFPNEEDLKNYWDKLHNADEGGNPMVWRTFQWFLYTSRDEVNWPSECTAKAEKRGGSTSHFCEGLPTGAKRENVPVSQFHKSLVC
ncbi:hypothetical protein COT99_02760 [Candidatus Falkowbacteria bacterium CG10_big_fil_rev_8_21_14_0_10_43_10]|uniref:Uncharacterized protein n=1 Tax=Candidatus Falkowbacteria bacterium CG10_big_fil_rev_8_21_14_0_10_43_10 TaxID=1974567 RepID=A0A2H0V1X6_9BACT|nr:MAG: hypothetical protein COT99_02760 [Candidatus Falkowbacteria bacterium CG10_big_fil_rev_8_21_14_0_10_43_10]